MSDCDVPAEGSQFSQSGRGMDPAELCSALEEIAKVLQSAVSPSVSVWSCEHVTRAFGWAQHIEQLAIELPPDCVAAFDDWLSQLQECGVEGIPRRAALKLTIDTLKESRALLLRTLLCNRCVTHEVRRATLRESLAMPNILPQVTRPWPARRPRARESPHCLSTLSQASIADGSLCSSTSAASRSLASMVVLPMVKQHAHMRLLSHLQATLHSNLRTLPAASAPRSRTSAALSLARAKLPASSATVVGLAELACADERTRAVEHPEDGGDGAAGRVLTALDAANVDPGAVEAACRILFRFLREHLEPSGTHEVPSRALSSHLERSGTHRVPAAPPAPVVSAVSTAAEVSPAAQLCQQLGQGCLTNPVLRCALGVARAAGAQAACGATSTGKSTTPAAGIVPLWALGVTRPPSSTCLATLLGASHRRRVRQSRARGLSATPCPVPAPVIATARRHRTWQGPTSSRPCACSTSARRSKARVRSLQHQRQRERLRSPNRSPKRVRGPLGSSRRTQRIWRSR